MMVATLACCRRCICGWPVTAMCCRSGEGGHLAAAAGFPPADQTGYDGRIPSHRMRFASAHRTLAGKAIVAATLLFAVVTVRLYLYSPWHQHQLGPQGARLVPSIRLSKATAWRHPAIS